MEAITDQVTAFLRRHGLDLSRLDVGALSHAFREDMARGLRGDRDAWMLMLPTYLGLEGTLPKDEPVIVIDAGGTNFRIGLVTMTETGPLVEDLTVFPMPGSQGAITWEEFLDQVSDAILPFTRRAKRVGLCFSYAAEILPNRDGRVIRLTKQVEIAGSDNQELGRDLSAALAAKGAPGVEFLVLNDTVAALLGGVAELEGEVFDGYVGLIYGTGVNTCYVEARDNLHKVTAPWTRENMIVNMESARFDGAAMSDFDKRLDENSMDPGLCHYEKMVSGRYGGEVVFHALRLAAEEGLFSPTLASHIQALEGLTLVQADAFAARPYGDNVLANACATEADREAVYAIIDAVTERSARLVCANLGGILLQTGGGRQAHRPVCVVAEGSTFYKGCLFRDKLVRFCQEELAGKLGLHLVFRQVKDANLLGTAAAALLNH